MATSSFLAGRTLPVNNFQVLPEDCVSTLQHPIYSGVTPYSLYGMMYSGVEELGYFVSDATTIPRARHAFGKWNSLWTYARYLGLPEVFISSLCVIAVLPPFAPLGCLPGADATVLREMRLVH